MDYKQQALDFLKSTSTVMKIKSAGVSKAPWSDKSDRNRYSVSLTRGGKSMDVDFYGSLHMFKTGISPSEYDILTCLVKWDPGSLGDFVQEYGYEMKDHKSVTTTTQTWMACVDEYRDVVRVFGDVLDELAEIQ